MSKDMEKVLDLGTIIMLKAEAGERIPITMVIEYNNAVRKCEGNEVKE